MKQSPMIYGSVCDGMGAAHVASRGLGWECAWLAEIDPAASATTEHHYPDVPNLGDITAPDFIDSALAVGGLDMLVGGTPCQSFSVAGLRNGLDDSRGNLTLRFVELADAVGHAGGPVEVVFYENVPGILSDETNAFGCLLAALVGEDSAIPAPRDGWTNAGLVIGPTRKAAWRVLDAQGFVAQRRRRVFVVAALHGSRVDPERVLFETEADALRNLGDRAYTGPLFPQREGVRGDTKAGGSAGEIVAALTANGVGTCGADDNQGKTGHLIPVAYGGGNASGPIDVSTAMTAHPGGRYDFDSETLVATAITGNITHALNTANNGKMCGEDGTGRGVPIVAVCATGDITHSLTTVQTGGSVTEDGTGRGSPIIATAVSVALRGREGGGMIEIWETGDRVDALTTGTDPSSHLVAFPILEPGARTGASTTDVRAGIGIGGENDPMFTLQAGKQHGVAVASHQDMAVRRLTPTECLRLQSFPPDYFDNVLYRGKPLADGSRYKMIGNSWNTDTVRWIFRRIDAEWRGGEHAD